MDLNALARYSKSYFESESHIMHTRDFSKQKLDILIVVQHGYSEKSPFLLLTSVCYTLQEN